MPYMETPLASPDQNDKSKPKKLVLCFDGTGNTFSGSTSDTNIVKLYNKFDRDTPDQFHYYQTGIGTYDIDGGSVNKGFFGRIRSSISRTIDAGIGTSFDAHVIAGYRFIMRYYDAGDKIYMFGFSRGAYTARFLSRMINTVGLLSKGNEEMVPFAYELYQRYEQGKLKNYGDPIETAKAKKVHIKGHSTATPAPASRSDTTPLVPKRGRFDAYNDSTDDDIDDGPKDIKVNELHAFSRTFCRREHVGTRPTDPDYYYTGVRVYFLGIFDCVNSVAVLEAKTPTPMSVVGTADYVRHAVAVDERRVKFKAALLNQDTDADRDPRELSDKQEDRKEVWFPGNHGDVGGGWPAPYAKKATFWDKVKALFKSPADERAAETGPFQMSDIPLAWMINELEAVGKQDPASAVEFSARKDTFLHKFTKPIWRDQALNAAAHDTMRLGGGSTLTKVLMWNLMEYLPFFPRWELNGAAQTWQLKRWIPNRGDTRDIPKNAVLHASLVARLRNTALRYRPRNNHGSGAPCLRPENLVPIPEANAGRAEGQWLYRFKAA